MTKATTICVLVDDEEKLVAEGRQALETAGHKVLDLDITQVMAPSAWQTTLEQAGGKRVYVVLDKNFEYKADAIKPYAEGADAVQLAGQEPSDVPEDISGGGALDSIIAAAAMYGGEIVVQVLTSERDMGTDYATRADHGVEIWTGHKRDVAYGDRVTQIIDAHAAKDAAVARDAPEQVIAKHFDDLKEEHGVERLYLQQRTRKRPGAE
ncbi:hypothetical protein HN419_03120 [Candidatus Woesearchaeota archaeon]|jgi:hypothetical protein|nr:hypothetical protein [Candidatus Woesearchaeota archaeon]MBT3537012.1 hypothetical protein [Candidatus Woesearchaeota archaeon]MBT4697622.1 hypothetical protein [Candidatus Woesearchaeota archaeon]MBT4716507.1 hypothetical protein [Candidatus Woesearchaeota archaeon]MBT7106678.1 hypothetical protein [Candidatus Woesearchaeota archaeon]